MNKLKNFPYEKAFVLGLAKSGAAAAHILLDNNVKVIVNDLKATEEDAIVIGLRQKGAKVVLGSHFLSLLDDTQVIIKNPGIPYDNIILKEAEKRHIPIVTEIELVGKLIKNPIIGITGSNGKTTTTTLIGEMLTQSGLFSKVAGNIGTVACEVAQTMKEDEILVLELSSFQLLGIDKFKPKTAILLNIFEAHLDYHKTLENYIFAKQNVFMNQTENDFLIYNADDDKVVEMIKDAQAKLIPFSRKKKLQSGAWINNESIYFKDEKIINLAEIVLVGEHNLENILAAISAAKINGATNQGIKKVLIQFSGVKHRLQFVKELNMRLFYNDSKATNVLATEKALASFKKPIILLAGGLDRGNEFDELKPYLSNVKALVLFGETAEKISRVGKEVGIEKIIIVKNMSEAVISGYGLSEEEDVLLLSPACASWDQYKTFEERGSVFIESVLQLK